MKKLLKILLFVPAIALMFIIDVPPRTTHFSYFQLFSEAHAVFGVRRRSVRRGVVIGSTAAATGATAAAYSTQQQPAPAPQQAPAPAPASQQAAPAPQQSSSGLLPMGKIVSTLPQGCTTMQAGGVEYHHCGVNYYRATFQGNKLVYVTVQP